MRDDLKRKAQCLAERQGVSLNNYIKSVIAASVAQEETLRFFRDKLQGVDLKALHKRVLKFMEKTRKGSDPSPEQLDELLGRRIRS
jgi:hypothetical protein